AGQLADELQDLRQSVAFLTDLHTSVRGLHVPETTGPGPIELRHLLHGALAVARAQLPPGTSIEVECDPDLVITGDRTDLGRVFVNLAVNAGHAMAEAKVAAPRLVLTGRRVGDRVHLSVADNGPGVPDALHEKIFEPRFTTRRRVGGSGLGLAITRQLLQDNGGGIVLGPSTEGGATFEVELCAAGAPVLA
ncbi:MAG: ATP-binding protein, partial [Myxococcota bacterium]